MGILLRLAASAAAVWIATLILDGIRVTAATTLGTIGTYVAIAVLFGVINAVLRPIIKTLGCAFYMLTLGLIALVVNGALLMLTSYLAGLLDLPFTVDNFWPSAVLGALIIGIASWLLNAFVKNSHFRRRRPPEPPRPSRPQQQHLQQQYPQYPPQQQYPAQQYPPEQYPPDQYPGPGSPRR